MIQNPLLILAVLVLIVTGAQFWAHYFSNHRILRFIPTAIWCYVPPTVLTTFEILPVQSAAYNWISAFILPACLILLLMTADLVSLRKIGKKAAIAMAGSTLCVFLAGVICFFLFRAWIGPETAKAIGTLMAGWTGGTANELAVKEATGLSDSLFSPLFISDITMVYIWMSFLLMLSPHQYKLDLFFSARSMEIRAITSENNITAQKKNIHSLRQQRSVFLHFL